MKLIGKHASNADWAPRIKPPTLPRRTRWKIYRWQGNKTVIMALGLVFLAGCALRKGGGTKASLGGGAHFTLISRPEPPSALAALQRVEFRQGKRSFRFQAHVELESGRLAMVGLTPMGNRGFALVLENGAMTYEHLPFYKLPLKPRELLALYQIMFWPLERLETHLSASPLEIRQEGGRRSLFKGRQEVLTIDYEHNRPWQGRVRLRNLARHYMLEIRTRHTEQLSSQTQE